MYSMNIQSLNNYFGMLIAAMSIENPLFSFSALNKHIGIKRVYIASQLIYAVGMLLMGYLRHRLAVIVLSAVAGILYSTLFTIPYLLISQYYASNTVCCFCFGVLPSLSLSVSLSARLVRSI